LLESSGRGPKGGNPRNYETRDAFQGIQSRPHSFIAEVRGFEADKELQAYHFIALVFQICGKSLGKTASAYPPRHRKAKSNGLCLRMEYYGQYLFSTRVHILCEGIPAKVGPNASRLRETL